MDKPLVSIIVPAYNVERYLDRCMSHLLEEKEVLLEVLLVDDGSTDSTGTIADAWAQRDARVKVFHTENRGQGMAKNLGLDNARGRYVFFHDSDDFVIWQGIKRLLAVIESGCYELVNGSYQRMVGETITSEAANVPEGDFCRLGTPEQQRLFHRIKTENLFGYCTNKLYRRDFLAESGVRFGNMREIALEDQLFNCMLYAGNPRSCYVNAPLFVYTIHEDSTSKKVDETLPERLSNMLETYFEFLEERGCVEQNQDLFVPLALRSYAWAGLCALRFSDNSRQAIARQLRYFLEKPCMKHMLSDAHKRTYLNTISSPAQRLAFKLFFDTARWGNGGFDACIFKIGAPVMNVYAKAVVK